tara:strand:- start:237 stop:746 length:510 start_codon:yes stop_codon:yes gene_type:complete
MKIKNINTLSIDNFIDTFKNIFEKTELIAVLSEKKRPFSNKNNLIDTFMIEFDNLKDEEKKNIIKNHPDLGNKLKIKNNLTEMSINEQKNAGLDNCTEEEYIFFSKKNNEFKLKFDLPFIFAVKGANKTEIITEFKRRLNNIDTKKEFAESIKQVKKIAFFRLDEIIDE